MDAAVEVLNDGNSGTWCFRVSRDAPAPISFFFGAHWCIELYKSLSEDTVYLSRLVRYIIVSYICYKIEVVF